MSKIHYDLFYNEVTESQFNNFYGVCRTLNWANAKDFSDSRREKKAKRELSALIFDYVYKHHNKIKSFCIGAIPYEGFFLNSKDIALEEDPSMVKIISIIDAPFERYEEDVKISDHSGIIKAIHESLDGKVFKELWEDQPALTKAQVVLIKKEYDKFQESGLDKYGFTIAIRFNANDGISVAIHNPYIDFRIPPELALEDYPEFCAKEALYALQFD